MSETLSNEISSAGEPNLAMSVQEFLVKYWGLLSFMAVVVFYGLWAYFKVGSHEDRIKTLEGGKEDMEKAVGLINERLARMDGKLDILVAGYKKEQ